MLITDNILITSIFKGRKKNYEFIEMRESRIREAINFENGTISEKKKNLVAKLSNGKEVYFLKPGKEAVRKNPNKYDMLPCIGSDGISETDGFSFEIIWEYLLKISIINQISFKKVLILIYRLCYKLDHIDSGNKKIRYVPNDDIMDYINMLDFSLKDGFLDKFKKKEIGLFEYLHFIDLLGWNEDVKYHIKNEKPFFEKNKRLGRVNTILTIISVPLMINDFLSNIIENVNYIEKINVRLILSTMQKLTRTRGICVLTNKELSRYLSPYLINN
jgi:hypothetical protein